MHRLASVLYLLSIVCTDVVVVFGVMHYRLNQTAVFTVQLTIFVLMAPVYVDSILTVFSIRKFLFVIVEE